MAAFPIITAIIGHTFRMETGAWLVLVTLLSQGPHVVAWPAPDMASCQRAIERVLEPTRRDTYCTPTRPKGSLYGPNLGPLAPIV